MSEIRRKLWERRWADKNFNPPWRAGGMVDEMRHTVENGWWTPGMRALDIGCGDGLIAAWLADHGFKVLGLDYSRHAIARARSAYAGRHWLAFQVLDVSNPSVLPVTFDALLDRGCLHGLDPQERLVYARNLVAWSHPGTRFLLMVHHLNKTQQRREDQVRLLLAPAFELMDVRQIAMEHPGSGMAIPGGFFRLVRREIPEDAARTALPRAVQGPRVSARNEQKRKARDEHGELHHWCHPLEDPRWVGVGEAGHMRADDPVLGLEFGGCTWALPWWIMKNHHMANLVLEGRPVLVTLCEVCSGAAAFDPVIDGRRHTFRLEGLYNGTIMPLDYETGSHWTGFSGEAVEGPLKGRIMERLPLLQCTWQEWVELHPDTVVPDGNGESREGHGEGHSPGSPMVRKYMLEMVQHMDTRLPHHELVLGVLVQGHSRCYPLAALPEHSHVLNDILGDEEIAVFWQPGSWMASAYRRRLDGQVLVFRTQGDAIVDEQTNSRWEISGIAGSGTLRGRQLQYVHSGLEEFYNWAAFHPETGIHGEAEGSPAEQTARSGRDIELIPAPIHRVTKRGWWTPGMSMLDVGCGDGLIAAWLAESGLHVLGVDPSPDAIAQARRSFRGVTRLAFETADLRRPVTFSRRFDALVDHGCFSRLATGERATYVSTVAAAASPGARFLLLAPFPPAAFEQRKREIGQLFNSSFWLVAAQPTRLPHPVAGDRSHGAALCLERR